MGCHATKQKKRDTISREHLSLPDTHEKQPQVKLLTPDTKLDLKKQQQIQLPLNKNKLIELLEPIHQQIFRNQKFQNDYFIMKDQIIGKGVNGRVFVVEHNMTGIKRIAKITRNPVGQTQLDNITAQLQALKRLNHPNVIKLFDFYSDNKHLYLVEEYGEGGNLFLRLKGELKSKLKIHVAFAFQQILSALAYLHSQGVIYKNLKTSSIVVASKEKFLVKVIGFEDLSELCRDSEIDISYQAPETFREDYVWNQSADIWSAGVVLFELETGIHPFRAETGKKTIENIMVHNFEEIEEWNELNDDTRILIAKMLEMYPKMRLPAKLCLKSRYYKSIQRSSVEVISVLSNMNSFQKNNGLKQILLSLMIDYLLPKEERERISQVFYQIDTNNDGRIQKSELLTAFQQSFNEGDAKQQVDEIFKRIQIDGKQEIEFSEFIVAACNQKEFLTSDHLKEFFSKLVHDHGKYISLNHLKNLFCNVDLNEIEWHQIIQLGEENINDKISYQEFVSLMSDIKI